MNRSENKDKALNEIRDNSFEYNAGSHAAMIADFERDGLAIVSRTKDGVDCDITDKGISFLCNGRYTAIEKEKSKERLKRNLERLFFTVLGGLLLALLQKLMPECNHTNQKRYKIIFCSFGHNVFIVTEYKAIWDAQNE